MTDTHETEVAFWRNRTKAYADAVLVALAGAGHPTPEQGYEKDGGPGQAQADITRALAELKSLRENASKAAVDRLLAELAAPPGGDSARRPFEARPGDAMCSCSPRGPYPLREGHSCPCWPQDDKATCPGCERAYGKGARHG